MTPIQALDWAVVQADIIALDQDCSPPLRDQAKAAALVMRELLLDALKFETNPKAKVIALYKELAYMVGPQIAPHPDNGVAVIVQHSGDMQMIGGVAYPTRTITLLFTGPLGDDI